MKKFKCPKCNASGAIDSQKYNGSRVKISCKGCGQSLVLNFGVTLTLEIKGQPKQEYKLNEGINSIGRVGGNAQIQIQDQFVSKLHGQFELKTKDGSRLVTYRDNSSTNGSFSIDKKKLEANKNFLIKANQSIIVGLSKLTIVY
jgi:ribosomal protein S27E